MASNKQLKSWRQTLDVTDLRTDLKETKEQAGAELCQAQVKLEVEVEIWVEVEACHY